MIVIAASELSSDSRMPHVKGSVTSDILEAITGADIMVTTYKAPVTTPALILQHIMHGAVLIQRKSGRDFISSIRDERINIALARMHEAGATHVHQRIIMSTGLFRESKDGEVQVSRIRRTGYLQWDTTPLHWKSYQTMIWRIAARGGYYLPLSTDADIPPLLDKIEKDLDYLAGHCTKDILTLPTFPPDPPEPSDPLQLPREVRDGRRVLAAFSGIGHHRATQLWTTMREYLECEPCLADAIHWASMYEPALYKGLPKVPGWGSGMRGKVRKQLGLLPGMDFIKVNVCEPREEDQ